MAVRSVRLPIEANLPWDDFGWPSKAPGDDLPYQLTAADWLKDAGLTIRLALVQHSPGLVVSAPRLDAAGQVISLTISGGAPGADSWVRFRLILSDGSQLTPVIRLPVRAEPNAEADDLVPVADPALDRVLTVGGVPLTAAGILIPT